MASLFIDTLTQGKQEHVPLWLMRQAGRYLPEYRALREKSKDFLDFCFTPERAAEVTLQPIERFGMDAAILFSDILVIPHALSQKLEFQKGEGPVLEAIKDKAAVEALLYDGTKLEPVMQTILKIKETLPEQKALIGFAGASWTIAAYMIEGKGSRDFQTARRFIYQQKEAFALLMQVVEAATVEYLCAQIKHGVQTVQLFDSWAGALSREEFVTWSLEPAKRITAAIKGKYPNVPVIGFPRGAGVNYKEYALYTGVDAVSLDSSVPMQWAVEQLPEKVVLQGNLDPVLLAEDKERALISARNILDMCKNKAFIFNLGHGILPHTPISHVQALVDLVQSYRA